MPQSVKGSDIRHPDVGHEEARRPLRGLGLKLLGALAEDDRQVIFQYSAEALTRGLDLSPRCLKLHAEAYGGFPSHLSYLPGLFSDALPDGWGQMLTDRLIR